MKFNYSLIKKLVPGNYGKEELVEKLNTFSFETADLGNDILDISITPNRFSDASSHFGIAREVATIFDLPLKLPNLDNLKFDSKSKGLFRVNVRDKKMCPRYMACYVADIKMGASPKWMKDVLESCGLRPINNIVDIMNYVMIEVGQPLHAFDADKLKGGIIVRRAEEKEKLETLDNQNFTLNKNILVIADDERPLAIAGIKGGKFAEVTLKTEHLIIEAANFDGAGIYKTSRQLGLVTDASMRFAHNLSPELAEIGIKRALQLLKELAGAKIYKIEDVYLKKQPDKIIKLDLNKMENLLGIKIKEVEVAKTLKSLGFVQYKKLWCVPFLRTDINNPEDITEEIIRFKDYNNLPAVPPHIALGIAEEDEIITLKEKIRKFFTGTGFSEVYNYSLMPKEETTISPIGVLGEKLALEISNPVSSQFAYLRDSLAPALIRNLKDNQRFYEEVKIFEIGKIFGKMARSGDIKEVTSLGVALITKNNIFELKGLVDALFGELGLTDYFMPDLNYECKILRSGEALRIETGDHHVLGYIGTVAGVKKAAILEIDLEKLLTTVDEEKEYEPLSKYPSVIRDISLLVSQQVRVGQILEIIQDVSPKLVNDVDLIDFYEDEKLGENKKSLTFRIVFQADDKTLTDEEVNKEMAIISKVIEEKFDVEFR